MVAAHLKGPLDIISKFKSISNIHTGEPGASMEDELAVIGAIYSGDEELTILQEGKSSKK
jgi:hypothetical protein